MSYAFLSGLPGKLDRVWAWALLAQRQVLDEAIMRPAELNRPGKVLNLVYLFIVLELLD
jgi:hypothetical protein